MRTAAHTGLWGPGLCTPAHTLSTRQIVEFLGCTAQLSGSRSDWLERLCEQSGIQRRHTCVPEFVKTIKSDAATDSLSVSCDDFLGGITGRMERFRKQAAPLAVAAGGRALKCAGLQPESVTHLVWVTCTGFENPGADMDAMGQLGLHPEVHRVQVGSMGCQAAIHGLRMADAICGCEPDAVVLLICVELCTLHFEPGRRDPESLVVATLFGDGAAAGILTRRSLADRPLLRLTEFASRRVPSGERLLTWRLGEPAFHMGLRRQLPAAVAAEVPGFVGPLLPRAVPAERTGWAIHPGGRAVLDAVESALRLPGPAMAPSRQILADFGNMSSPTLLFVLDRVPRDLAAGVALAFGPGLSLEGLRWSRGT